MTGCSDSVTNESHSRAKCRLGSHPAGSIPCGGVGRPSTFAAFANQLVPPHESVAPRHQIGLAGGIGVGHSVALLPCVVMNPYDPVLRVVR